MRVVSVNNALWFSGYGFLDFKEKGVLIEEDAHTYQIFNPFINERISHTSILIIAEDKLGEGAKYKVKVTAAHSDSTGFSEIVFSTNAPPTAGRNVETDFTSRMSHAIKFVALDTNDLKIAPFECMALQ